MNSLPLFGLSVLMSFVAFGFVTRTYIWPRLRMARRKEALIALTVTHTFRFIGLSVLIPGVVSPSLPSGFQQSAKRLKEVLHGWSKRWQPAAGSLG
jgi:hypothetical protein